MTKEKISELWSEAWNDLGKPNVDFDSFVAIRDEFVNKLLFECAKIVCMNCKNGNASEPTNQPSRRVHKVAVNYHESCRAVAFFIEGEQ